MNGYIINPSWFYWLKVVDNISIVLIVFAVIATAATAVGLPAYWFDDVFDEAEEKQFRKIAKGMIVGVVILWLLVVFVPSKSTLIEMQIAKYATYENAEWTIESIKSAVDYIIDAIKSLK